MSIQIASAQQFGLNSPNSELSIIIDANDHGIDLRLSNRKGFILGISNIGIATTNPVATAYKVKKVSRDSKNSIVNPIIKEKSKEFKSIFKELTLEFESNWSLTFRLFDEGLAYRITTNSPDSLMIIKENLNIQFEKDDSVRFQSEESFQSAYEQPYDFRVLHKIAPKRFINLPVLIQKQNGTFVMVAESDLFRFPGLWLRYKGQSLMTAAHPKYPKSYVVDGSPYDLGQVNETHNYIARVAGNRTLPWRIFGIAEGEEGLIQNNLVYLLSSPSELKDISWIKPGVVIFDWWAKNKIYGVDFKAGINTETAKYFIDFCAEKGFRYFLFDDGWSPKTNVRKTVPGLDMKDVTSYAEKKGVYVMVWVLWNSLKNQLDSAFNQFEKWGIKGIKMDFMNRDDQEMVEFYERVAKKAADKKMVVDFHGAYKPAGLRRKFPNILTREALLEFEQSGVSYNDNPEHHNLLPYIRMFAGPMDYIPGTLRNSNKNDFRPIADYPMGMGTRAHSIALFIILNSPMTMLPGSPTDYRENKECIDFLSRIPVEWDETKLLKGKIGQFTILARRNGSTWYIGAITNQERRMFEISTNFLDPGNYTLDVLQDGLNSETAAVDYRLSRRKIKAGDVLTLNLKEGGGWSAIITLDNSDENR